MRPRLLLVPMVTELEWAIRPQLEQWAEVATFDVPGVGAEPPVEPLDRQAIVNRGLQELDRHGWDKYILVADGSCLPTAVRVAYSRPDAVEAMALGHTRLCNRIDGERPTVNKEVFQAFGQLAETNFPDFVRYGLTQMTHGSIGDDLARQMLEHVPIEIGRAVWTMNVYDSEPFEHLIRAIDVPLLLAKHEGCLGSTDEGFEDAVAAFPDARTIAVPEAPSVTPEFADAATGVLRRCPKLGNDDPKRAQASVVIPPRWSVGYHGAPLMRSRAVPRLTFPFSFPRRIDLALQS